MLRLCFLVNGECSTVKHEVTIFIDGVCSNLAMGVVALLLRFVLRQKMRMQECGVHI